MPFSSASLLPALVLGEVLGEAETPLPELPEPEVLPEAPPLTLVPPLAPVLGFIVSLLPVVPPVVPLLPGDAAGLAIAVCACLLQASKSAWVGSAAWAAPENASNAAAATNALR
jgi:hypothetical protein